jgi:tetratricopeptide (TPR) repeat protein
MAVDQVLQQAIAHHKAGKLQDAERLYRSILQSQPNHPDANHNLGVLAVQFKQSVTALPYFKIALEANPDQGQYWLSYIDALIRAGQADAARQVLEQGRKLGLNGDAVDALAVKLEEPSEYEPPPEEINMLVAQYNQGRYVEAEALARGLTERFPAHGLAWKVLGATFMRQGRRPQVVIRLS